MKTISVNKQVGNSLLVQEMQQEIICLLCKLNIPYDELEVLLPLILNKSDTPSIIESLFELYAFEKKNCSITSEVIKGKYRNTDICPMHNLSIKRH